MVFIPATKYKPYIGTNTDLEQWTVKKSGYAVKRIRYNDGDTGCVIAYKYNKDGVGIVIQKYNTCNKVDELLYEALVNTLDTKNEIDFAWEIKNMLVPADIRPYIHVEKDINVGRPSRV